MDAYFDIPILFMTFNRPAETRAVLEVIKAVRPTSLFISSDGPRAGRADDVQSVEEVRSVLTEIDWDCEVKTLFHEANVGCKRAGINAISWFFEQVEYGIILEDDCLPSKSFFYYCKEVLERYRDDNRVVHINGNNFDTHQHMPSDYSYHFTYFPQVWGWATWRRAWKRFDESMSPFDAFDDYLYFKHAGLSERDYANIRRKWHNAKFRDFEVWDYQWHFINLLEGGLVVSPLKNLISNVGFGEKATHTADSYSLKQNLVRNELEFPLKHPPCLFIDEKLNQHYINMMVTEPVTFKLKRKLREYRSKIAGM